ncbi:MAG: S8 family serine peptidase [Candidatus Kapaibacteriota bacterium]|jgi:subtilisin family serine protease
MKNQFKTTYFQAIITLFIIFIINNNRTNSELIKFQNDNKLSPLAKMLLLDLQKETAILQNKDKENGTLSVNINKYDSLFYFNFNQKYDDFQIYNFDKEYYVGVILLTNGKDISQKLTNFGCLVGLVTKDIISIKIPPHKISKLLDFEEILYLQVDEKVGLNLDKVKTETKFNLLHNGSFLNKSIKGNGVIVGIIDAGFDFTHSAFFRDKSTTSRISRAWIQHRNSSGRVSPVGFSYGDEKIGTSLQFVQYDYKDESHGTHVSGIAAGNGEYNGYQYEGIAPASEIVMVSPIFLTTQSITTGQTNILDGIKYIFNYADVVNKPVVINMSLGSTIGPRDGTALFDRACDNLKSRGKILVTAAGNSGISDMHLMQNFNTNKNPLKTIVDAVQTSSNDKQTYVDIWGEKGNDIEIELGINTSGSEIWHPVKFKTSQNGITEVTLRNSSNSITYAKATVTLTKSEFNGKPRVFISFEDIKLSAEPMIRLTANNNGIIHLWNAGLGGSSGSDFNNGNTDYTVTEIGGTGKSIVSVASYTTKNQTTNYFNQAIGSGFPTSNGDISPFSSIGPSVDGRFKPEISAPGSLITSAFNSNSNTYSLKGASRSFVIDGSSKVFQNKDFYGIMEGTSMSSPLVTGAVALMLEVYPNLSIEEVTEILKITALNDIFTGDIKKVGDKYWGYGKLNILGAVEMASEMGKFFGAFPELMVYPNPTTDDIYLQFSDSTSGNYKFTIYDILGSIIDEKNETLTSENFSSKIFFDLKKYSLGTYILKVENNFNNRIYLIQKSY